MASEEDEEDIWRELKKDIRLEDGEEEEDARHLAETQLQTSYSYYASREYAIPMTGTRTLR